jgi:hypothetical protein
MPPEERIAQGTTVATSIPAALAAVLRDRYTIERPLHGAYERLRLGMLLRRAGRGEEAARWLGALVANPDGLVYLAQVR